MMYFARSNNLALMTKPFNVATYVLLGLGSFLAQAQTHNSSACLAQGAAIYTVGEDHVKPPKVRNLHVVGVELPTITSNVICEVLQFRGVANGGAVDLIVSKIPCS